MDSGEPIRVSVRQAYERGIAAHQAGRLGEAEEIYRQLLAQRPGHAGALHHLGVLFQQRGNLVEAERLIRSALNAEPADADAWGNLAVLYRVSGRRPEALQAARQALQLHPAHRNAAKVVGLVLLELGRLPEAQKHLENTIQHIPGDQDTLKLLARVTLQLGQSGRALEIFSKIRAQAPDDIEILNNLSIALKELGRFEEALEPIERAIRLKPDSVDTLNNLGTVYLMLNQVQPAVVVLEKAHQLGSITAAGNLAVAYKRLGRFQEASELLQAVLAKTPDDVAALINYGDVLNELDRPAEALAPLQKALQAAPDSPQGLNNLGVALGKLDRIPEAVTVLEQALAAVPDYLPAHHNLGNQLLGIGQIDRGLEHLRKALELDPKCVPAWYGLATTGRYDFTEAELARLEALVQQRHLTAQDRSLLHFALAHAFDKARQPAKAFPHARSANLLRRSSDPRLAFDRAAHTALVDGLIALFTPEFVAAHRESGLASDVPIFVVGMPRSGTTLVEQILASHPQVHGGGELEQIARIACGWSARFSSAEPYPACLATATADQFREVAREHVAFLEKLGAGRTRVVDKMTVNFLHLGLIALLFPKAKIIHTRRDPRDTALSCFFHNFAAPGLAFTFDLGDLAHFYREGERLFAHWRAVLPNPMLELDYESLVADQETQSRALLEYCGLPWDPACLNFHQSQRRVKTASVLQVREPIYTRAVARWKPYESFLEGFGRALEGEPLPAESLPVAKGSPSMELNNRGVLLANQGRLEEAIACYREASEKDPGYFKPYLDLGIAYYRLGKLQQALAALDAAQQRAPDNADTAHNRGVVLGDLGRLEEGLRELQKATELNPHNADTWNTLGAAAHTLGELDTARRAYEHTLALEPNHTLCRYNRACGWLAEGDYAKGWPEHEFRLRREDLKSLNLPALRWDGQPLEGTLLLLAEQGLGDTLQFVRYIKAAKARCKRVILMAQSALLSMLAGLEGVDGIVSKSEPLPAFDAYLPLLSLPHLFWDLLGPAADTVPYLRADPERVDHWRKRLANTDSLRVGLNWQGNPKFPRDFLRSIPLREFEAIAPLEGVTYFNLHVGAGQAQFDELGAQLGIVGLNAEFDLERGAFVDTAAAMQALDLIITTDTSLAHLAGALGVEVWVLLSATPDWRWLYCGDQCPWYPGMRLFRQRTLRDWSVPLAEVRQALLAHLERK